MVIWCWASQTFLFYDPILNLRHILELFRNPRSILTTLPDFQWFSKKKGLHSKSISELSIFVPNFRTSLKKRSLNRVKLRFIYIRPQFQVFSKKRSALRIKLRFVDYMCNNRRKLDIARLVFFLKFRGTPGILKVSRHKTQKVNFLRESIWGRDPHFEKPWSSGQAGLANRLKKCWRPFLKYLKI